MNGVGGNAQQNFTLTVIAPVCTPPPANMIGWWPADGNPIDIQGGNDVSFQGSVTYGSGKVAQAFSFNGSDYATAGNPAALNLTGNQVTIDGWVNPSVAMSTEAVFFGKFGNGAIQYILEWVPGGGGTLAGRVNNGSTEAVFTPPTGTWTHLALVYNGSATPSVTVYVNGVVLVASTTATGNINSTTSPFLIGGTPDVRDFNGLVDEVEVFDRALGATEIGDIYNASTAGKCIPPLQLSSAVSRKTHGAAGTFDVPLPLTGAPGIECRESAGNHTLVFSFTNAVVSGNASVTSGAGSVTGSPTFAGKTMSVNLTGVNNAQQITVKLSGVTDAVAQVLPDKTVNMIVLAGDTTGNKAVNSSDIAQTKAQSGAPVNGVVSGGNFREDVTVSGEINSSDISLVKSRSGTAVP
jgi:hypothetical protein